DPPRCRRHTLASEAPRPVSPAHADSRSPDPRFLSREAGHVPCGIPRVPSKASARQVLDAEFSAVMRNTPRGPGTPLICVNHVGTPVRPRILFLLPSKRAPLPGGAGLCLRVSWACRRSCKRTRRGGLVSAHPGG